MTPDEAVEQLSSRIGVVIAEELSISQAEASVFLEFLIGLLPILADLLGKHCAPEDGAGLRALFNAPGLRGRFFRWRYRDLIRNRVRSNEEFSAWGSQLTSSVEKVLTDEANDALVTEALKARPAPIWSLFSSGS